MRVIDFFDLKRKKASFDVKTPSLEALVPDYICTRLPLRDLRVLWRRLCNSMQIVQRTRRTLRPPFASRMTTTLVRLTVISANTTLSHN